MAAHDIKSVDINNLINDVNLVAGALSLPQIQITKKIELPRR
jgi:hypothetical protein